jgi:hypothetical protein
MSALEKEVAPPRLYKHAKRDLSNLPRLSPFNCDLLTFADVRGVGDKCGEIKWALKIRYNGVMEKFA